MIYIPSISAMTVPEWIGVPIELHHGLVLQELRVGGERVGRQCGHRMQPFTQYNMNILLV